MGQSYMSIWLSKLFQLKYKLVTEAIVLKYLKMKCILFSGKEMKIYVVDTMLGTETELFDY